MAAKVHTHQLNGGNTEVVGRFQGHHLPVSADFHDEQVASGVKDASHEAAVAEGRRSPPMSSCTAVVELSTYGLELVDTLSCQDSNSALVRWCSGFEQRHLVDRMVQLLENYLAIPQL